MADSKLKVLVTAGATWTMLDKVRAVTNIFTGNTGFHIGRQFCFMGHDVTLAYNPRLRSLDKLDGFFCTVPFITFDDLMDLMNKEISSGRYDLVIHSAAVSDYGKKVTQLVETEVDMEAFDILPEGAKVFVPVSSMPGKMKSNLPELTLNMTKNPKIVDSIKTWDPDVFLVKFKLEVGRDAEDLCQVAEKSMKDSNADMIVANDLEGPRNNLPGAIIIRKDGTRVCVLSRQELARILYDEIMKEFEKRG